jgi:hypothetical protein
MVSAAIKRHLASRHDEVGCGAVPTRCRPTAAERGDMATTAAIAGVTLQDRR